MPKPRILLSRRWPRAVEDHLSQRYDVKLNTDDRPLTIEAFAKAIREFDVLCPTVTDKLSAEVIDTPDARVRLIANYGVGFDHIDLDACRRNGIAVTNTPGVLTDATADLALALMLMCARRAGEGERELRAGDWTGWRPTHLLGRDVSGATLGLVGFGRIAQAVAFRAHHGFGMRILYYSRRAGDAADERVLSATRVASLADLAAAADYVSVHVPGGSETRHMIDGAFFAAMKDDAILINTARGEVVDHDALAKALRTGAIGGAGLDVYPAEPTVPPALLDAPNTVLLPHLGSATREVREAMGMRAALNIAAWAEDRPLPDRIA